MSLNYLITGSTGFLGGELLRSLLLRPDTGRIFIIIRPSDHDTPTEKLERLIDHWEKFFAPLTAAQRQKIEVIPYDLSSHEVAPSIDSVDYFIHSAANTDLGQKLGEARICNLRTTQRAVELAHNLKGLKRFVFMSTAYVAGKSRGVISETVKTYRFNNHYERSKYESEDCVQNSGLPFTILRPSIVVGRSDNGYFRKLKVLYSVWRVWLYGVLPRAPLDPKSKVDFVPVDYVTKATIELMRTPVSLQQTYLLCAGEKHVSPYEVMLVAANSFQVSRPPLTRPWVAYLIGRWPLRKFFSRQVLDVLDTLFHHIHYIGIRGQQFDTDKADSVLEPLGVAKPGFTSYGEVMFGFCYHTKWGKKRTDLAKLYPSNPVSQ